MLARGIRSYHRPGRLEDALDLARQGVAPLAGGTRLLASPIEVPNLLDLQALGLVTLESQDGDLTLGAMVTLQDLVESESAHSATAGLLPEACRAQTVSRILRGMATVGGEAVAADADSEVVAALLALNAVFKIVRSPDPVEVPALRFLKRPSEDLAGGGLLQSVLIPGAPQGAALERIANLPSAQPLLAVVATVSFSQAVCARARLAFTGLTTSPARVLEAEARLEGTTIDEKALTRCIEQVVARAPFRDDARVSAAYRRAVAPVLVRRVIGRAIERAQRNRQDSAARSRQPRAHFTPTIALPYFTSGRLELTVNGELVRTQIEARTTLLEALRKLGYRGVKHGCANGSCGACTVLLDGRPVATCLTPAVRAQGRSVLTIEGLGRPGQLHPLQAAFLEAGAFGCGHCAPARLLCAKAMLDASPEPEEDEVRDALAGVLCACTGDARPIQAVIRAGREMKKG